MLLCISTTLAKLTNHTIDPAVQPEQLPRGVDESDIGWDINNYPELDYCSAVYVFLNAVGGCVFAVDNVDVGAWNDMPSPDGGIKLVYSNTSLCSEPHVLVIAPRRADVDIELDYIIYTVDVKDPRVGAIVGDVIGGIAVLGLGVFVLLSLVRRRNQRRRILNFQRWVPLGGGESDKDNSSIKMVLREKP
ncbi:hypothetical protein K438DRAFT_1783552 [Mycena galopus ATCC 62051]|nr:hypothetical protein K438DRAFT_1783552 [Mycena galopus ATCC 62051]